MSQPDPDADCVGAAAPTVYNRYKRIAKENDALRDRVVALESIIKRMEEESRCQPKNNS